MTQIEISFHSKSDVKVIDIENYNENEVLKKLENTETQHIKIGRNIYSKIDIKNIEIIE